MTRRFQRRSASLAAIAGVSVWVTPTSTHRPGPMPPTTVRPPSTVTRALLTRCTKPRMKGAPYRPVGCPFMCAAEALPEDRPLRIAYLSYRGKPHVGGQGVYTRHLTKALVDLGHSVEVLGGQPYPVLDDRITLTKLPSLDIFNDNYPGRFPAYWELKHWEDWVEVLQFSFGTFSEPLAFSLRAWSELRHRAGEFDLVHDNQCLGY